MKTPILPQLIRPFARCLQIGAVACLVAGATGASASAATTISGLVGMGTTASGNWTGDTRWHTLGGNIVAFYVVGSGNLLDPFLNGPSDAQAAVSIPLGFGTPTFSLFAAGGIDNAFHGLNLFFNGNNVNPGISVFAPTQTSSTPPFPAFSANGAANSQSLAGQTVAAANSLSFNDGTSIVTLTDFHWATPEVYNIDRVGFVPFGQAFVGSDARLDRVAQFSLSVVPVPEPGTWTLLGLGLAGLVARRFARGRWS